ncbi:uncharacterized protein LOC111023795 [Momordica charantia]|uniref:Uncharacterized protein LOC111023795 n=1 Tax=Momordica charantia TaxID=3673 RepID=A0A6J1DTC4_MOMCH|nr:uncharacterized protein LOC111023795 [Momordica charantia]
MEKEKGEMPRTDNARASVSKANGKLKQPDQVATPAEYVPVPPYPKRLQKKNQDGESKRFLEYDLDQQDTRENEGSKKLHNTRISIGGQKIGQALCDLGVSINLMPLSVYKRLGMGEVRPKTVTLQFSDRSIAHLEGKIEDVLVQVDKFIFPSDFIVLDFDADRDVSIILGRPFLAT